MEMWRLWKPLLICALVLGALPMGGCAGSRTRDPVDPDSVGSAEAQALGIEVVALRRSAAGYMLDLRYRVIDREKAAPLVDRKVQPYLLDQATGAKLFVPSSAKVGPLRQTGAAVEGRIYFALFANPGKYVEPGRKVTLVLGDRRVPDLPVE
jgi:hypothetical protein